MEQIPKIVARRPRKEWKHARAHRLNGLDRLVPCSIQGRGPPRRRRVNEKRAHRRVRQKTLIVQGDFARRQGSLGSQKPKGFCYSINTKKQSEKGIHVSHPMPLIPLRARLKRANRCWLKNNRCENVDESQIFRFFRKFLSKEQRTFSLQIRQGGFLYGTIPR